MEKDTMMIYVILFSYLQFIKSLSSQNDHEKLKHFQEELGVQHH